MLNSDIKALREQLAQLRAEKQASIDAGLRSRHNNRTTGGKENTERDVAKASRQSSKSVVKRRKGGGDLIQMMDLPRPVAAEDGTRNYHTLREVQQSRSVTLSLSLLPSPTNRSHSARGVSVACLTLISIQQAWLEGPRTESAQPLEAPEATSTHTVTDALPSDPTSSFALFSGRRVRPRRSHARGATQAGQAPRPPPKFDRCTRCTVAL